MQDNDKNTGFTIVELLIVIVVIAILAAITIVAFNGVQKRARDTSMVASLKQAAQQAATQYITDGAYPTTLKSNGPIALTITSSGSGFCITGVADGYTTKSVNQSYQYSDAPCEGVSGGAAYCPNDSYVVINGYYCDGSVGGAASSQSGATKLLASDAQVPTGAPAYYVGRQTSRDVVGTNVFTAAPGDVFCTSGWATTVSSTVNHRIGVQFILSTGNSWQGAVVSPTSATGSWQKASGCFTAPANTTNAKLWTQNDGSNGSTADPAWYQTAITLTKQ